MKLLHILCELNPSGAETMLLCAAPYMQENGIEGEILATGAKPGIFADTLKMVDYKIHHIPFKKNINYFLEVYKLIKQQKYDSIHIHTEQASFWITLVLLLAGIPAKRCVRTIHNTFEFTGNLGWRRRWQRRLLCYLGVPHIAISKSVQDTELKHFKIHTPIIQNWYDSQRFCKTTKLQYKTTRQNLNLKENNFVICTVGNCSLVKNHSALIAAIGQLKNENIVYLHIGIEPDNKEQQQADSLGISQQIRFMGAQENILPYLQSADLFVMPSTYEGFGIAAIEAIATEVPVLLTKVQGLKDFSSIFNDLHYCEPTIESIHQALLHLVASPKQHLKQGTTNNSCIAVQRFGINRGVSEYMIYYKG